MRKREKVSRTWVKCEDGSYVLRGGAFMDTPDEVMVPGIVKFIVAGLVIALLIYGYMLWKGV